MLRLNRTLGAVLCVISLSGCNKAVERPEDLFPTATTVRVYLYEPYHASARLIMSDDWRTRNQTAVPADGIVLTETQVQQLKRALLGGRPPSAISNMCMFDPHHAFIFSTSQGAMVGTVDVCFKCGDVEYNAPGFRYTNGEGPRAAAGIPAADETVDYAALEKLVTELGLPVHPAAADYVRLRNPAPH